MSAAIACCLSLPEPMLLIDHPINRTVNLRIFQYGLLELADV